MRTILLLTVNALRVLLKKKSNIIVYAVLPVLGVAMALGVNALSGNPPIRVGVVDQDGGRLAAGLVAELDASDRFSVHVVAEDDIRRLVALGSIDCGLLVPSGYEQGILRGHAKEIVLLSVKGETVTAWLEPFVEQYSAGLRDMAAAAGDASGFDRMYQSFRTDGARLTVEKLPDASSGSRIAASSLGYLIMFLMLGAGMTTQLVLAEKRDRTYYRICSAPVHARQYILGNGAAATLIIAVQVILVQLIMRLVLRIDTRVPDLLLFAILMLYGLVSVALGMLIASCSRSTGMATALSTLIVSPTCMLAGCFWPLSLMPTLMQRLALFTPQRWVLDAVEKVQKGAPPAGIGINLVVIAAFAVAFFLVASYRFSRTEESGQFV